MNLVLDHHDPTIVGCMLNQMIRGMNFDVRAISTEEPSREFLRKTGSAFPWRRPHI
jgi:hypothetical protein